MGVSWSWRKWLKKTRRERRMGAELRTVRRVCATRRTRSVASGTANGGCWCGSKNMSIGSRINCASHMIRSVHCRSCALAYVSSLYSQPTRSLWGSRRHLRHVERASRGAHSNIVDLKDQRPRRTRVHSVRALPLAQASRAPSGHELSCGPAFRREMHARAQQHSHVSRRARPDLRRPLSSDCRALSTVPRAL